MRPFELLLPLANLLTFLTLVIRLPRIIVGMRYVAPIVLMIFIAQALVGDAHWQMVPAHVLAVVFFLVWVWFHKNIAQVDQTTELKRIHPVAFGLAIGLGIFGLTISIVLPIILPIFHFPTPSGSYKIGTITYHWTDIGRREFFSLNPKARRELMVQIWYPAKKGSSSSNAPYIQNAGIVATTEARLHDLPYFFFQSLNFVKTNATESVTIAVEKPSYPVLIYLEGLTGYRQMTTFQVEDLVSHGYIVVGIDQPGAASVVIFPDGHQIVVPSLNNVMQPLIHQSLSPVEPDPLLNGRTMPNGIIPYFAQDVSFVLDQLASINTTDPKRILTDKLELQHTGVFGMSLGGMVAAEASLKDPRIKACLIEDVALTADVVRKGLKQPCMFITRPAYTMRLERQKAGGWAEKDIAQTLNTMRAVYNSLPGDGYFVQLPGLFHIDFTDLDLMSPVFPTIGISGQIDIQRAHDLINEYSLSFFNKYLKGEPEALLDRPKTQFFEKHQP